MASMAGEQVLHGETLKYQTWVLKVLIHCDGCKKRVKKVLQGIEGVYTTEVDSLQHKVTVTGNVDVETLIKKLSRSGKLVELWPQKPPAPPEKKKDKNSGKSKGGGNINKEKKESDQKNNSTEPVDEAGGGSNEEEGKNSIEENNSEKEPHSDEDECEGGAVENEGGKKKKKKKKKKQNKGENNVNPVASSPNNNGGIEKGEGISKIEGGNSSLDTSKDVNDFNIPPIIQHAYPYPPPMYYSPISSTTQTYGLSYNTAYPVSSASYYVGAPMMPMNGYSASYSRFPPSPPPSDPIKIYGGDDDAYQGGFCSIM